MHSCTQAPEGSQSHDEQATASQPDDRGAMTVPSNQQQVSSGFCFDYGLTSLAVGSTCRQMKCLENWLAVYTYIFLVCWIFCIMMPYQTYSQSTVIKQGCAKMRLSSKGKFNSKFNPWVMTMSLRCSEMCFEEVDMYLIFCSPIRFDLSANIIW